VEAKGPVIGKIKPILNLSWAMAPPAERNMAEATADTMNARFFIEGVSKGKRGKMIVGEMPSPVL
jgi:hypothetical protein